MFKPSPCIYIIKSQMAYGHTSVENKYRTKKLVLLGSIPCPFRNVKISSFYACYKEKYLQT